MRPKIMYIEDKSESINSVGRIGRVHFSKTGSTLYYDGKEFRSLKGGYKANYFDVATGDQYWIPGPKRDGRDRLYGVGSVDIDEDVRIEYWSSIRNEPKLQGRSKS